MSDWLTLQAAYKSATTSVLSSYSELHSHRKKLLLFQCSYLYCPFVSVHHIFVHCPYFTEHHAYMFILVVLQCQGDLVVNWEGWRKKWLQIL